MSNNKKKAVNGKDLWNVVDKDRFIANAVLNKGLLKTEFRVLHRLLDHYHYKNDDTHGQCNPSYETLGRPLGIAVRTVRKAIAGLTTKGFLKAEQLFFKNSNSYEFEWEKWAVEVKLEGNNHIKRKKKPGPKLGSHSKKKEIGPIQANQLAQTRPDNWPDSGQSIGPKGDPKPMNRTYEEEPVEEEGPIPVGYLTDSPRCAKAQPRKRGVLGEDKFSEAWSKDPHSQSSINSSSHSHTGGSQELVADTSVHSHTGDSQELVADVALTPEDDSQDLNGGSEAPPQVTRRPPHNHFEDLLKESVAAVPYKKENDYFRDLRRTKNNEELKI